MVWADKLSKVVFALNNQGISNLKTIGRQSFMGLDLNNIEIPYSVTSIGQNAFTSNINLTKLTFSGSLTERIENGENINLLNIDDFAFSRTNLTYGGTNEDDYLKIPARVNSIGNQAFGKETDSSYLTNLKFIRYMGNRTQLNDLGDGWYPSWTTVKAYG